jgi:hypothetical protein
MGPASVRPVCLSWPSSRLFFFLYARPARKPPRGDRVASIQQQQQQQQPRRRWHHPLSCLRWPASRPSTPTCHTPFVMRKPHRAVPKFRSRHSQYGAILSLNRARVCPSAIALPHVQAEITPPPPAVPKEENTSRHSDAAGQRPPWNPHVLPAQQSSFFPSPLQPTPSPAYPICILVPTPDRLRWPFVMIVLPPPPPPRPTRLSSLGDADPLSPEPHAPLSFPPAAIRIPLESAFSSYRHISLSSDA